MIPLGAQISDAEITEIVEPSKTYFLDFENGRVVGFIDELQSVRQFITKTLITNRYEHDIYNPDYASQLQSLAGKDYIYVKSEVVRLVTEALTVDDRIIRVDTFNFEQNRENLSVTFTVSTIFGNLTTGVTLNV